MICKKCNHQLPEDSEFCQYCGNKLDKESIATLDMPKQDKPTPTNKGANVVAGKTELDNLIQEEKINATTKFPIGFVFENTKTESVIKRDDDFSCTQHTNVDKKQSSDNKVGFFTNVFSIILTIIAMFSIIIAMNVQDYKRNYLENWNTTAVYFVLLLILGGFLIIVINSARKNKLIPIVCSSPILIITTIIVLAEGSVTSSAYWEIYYNYYSNYALVDELNIIWVICVISIFAFSLVASVAHIVAKCNFNYRKSIAYREKCYKKVAQIHTYLEKGIITQEEYEKTKSDILKHIQ